MLAPDDVWEPRVVGMLTSPHFRLVYASGAGNHVCGIFSEGDKRDSKCGSLVTTLLRSQHLGMSRILLF